MIDIAILRAAGLTDAQIVAVVDAENKAQLELLADKRERDRIRKRNQRSRPQNPMDDVDSTDAADTPSPPSSFSPTPPHITTPSSPRSSLRSDSHIEGWPNDFREQFWNAYPRRIGKKEAIRALERVRRQREVTFAQVMAAIGRIETKDPQFVPYPATWINRGSYLDGDLTSTGPPLTEAAREILRKTAERNAENEKRKLNGQGTGKASDTSGTGGTDHEDELFQTGDQFH